MKGLPDLEETFEDLVDKKDEEVDSSDGEDLSPTPPPSPVKKKRKEKQ